MDTVIDKRTKAYKESQKVESKDVGSLEDVLGDELPKAPPQDIDYTNRENNPGFKLCMRCGAELPPNDDGSPRFRKTLELCHDCVWRNNK